MDEAGGLMAKVDLPYVQRFEDRHGKVRHYFRRPGYRRVALPGDPWSPEFMAAYQTALGRAEKCPVAASQTKPGTIGALLVEFYLSDYWRNTLKANTQANYRNILERFRADYGHNLVVDLSKSAVQSILDEKTATPGAARSFLKRLRVLLDFAVERDYRADNPARLVKLRKIKTTGFHPWTDAEIEAFKAFHPPGSRARRAMALLLHTTQRRSDVHRMGRPHIVGNAIRITQVKGRKGEPPVELLIEIHPELKAELDLLPAGELMFVTTKHGRPYTAAGFTNWFVDEAKRAGLSGCTPHGLRKAGSRHYAEAGASTHQIAAITGHKSLSEIERYTRSADQAQLARGAVHKLAGGKARTRNVKP